LINFVYESDKIVIDDIEVIGTKNVTKTEIKELLPFKIGDNLLRVKLSEVENEIKKLKPELKNISVNRRWKKIKIKLYERTPEAFVMHDDIVFGIDFDDCFFPLRGFMSTIKVPRLIYKSNDERKQLLDFIKKFKFVCGEFLSNLSEVKFNDTEGIVFVMRDGTIVFWGSEKPEHTSRKFKKFQKIYADATSKYKKIEYVNMTLYYHGKVVIKHILSKM
jgi:cell division protein FtsQ